MSSTDPPENPDAVAAMDPTPTAPDRRPRRSRWEFASLILVPLVVDLVVAILVMGLIAAAGRSPGGIGPIDLVPVGPEVPHAGPLAVADFDTLLMRAEEATGHSYDCRPPWRLASGSIKWACRSPQLLVVIEANALGEVYQLDATWFGFDNAATDLPTWASVAQARSDLATDSAGWVSAHLGDEAETKVGRARITVGGARGALTLRVSG